MSSANASAVRWPSINIRCHWRPVILIAWAMLLFGVFWFASRYPQLFSKAEHIGQVLPSMAYSSEVLRATADAPLWRRILSATINWLDSMKLGMSFGVLVGALLHTELR